MRFDKAEPSLVRLRCNRCGSRGPAAPNRAKAEAKAAKLGWNAHLGICRTCRALERKGS